MASDSQITYDDGTFTDNTRKIVQIQFANGSALLGKALSKETGDIFQDRLQQMAISAPLTDARRVADAALKETRNHMLSQSHHEKDDPEKVRQRQADRKAKFLLACYEGKQPRIFSALFDSGFFVPCHDSFTTAGGGQTLARYLMRGFDFKSVGLPQGRCLASYFVAACFQCDDGCRGPIQIGEAMETHCVLLADCETAELESVAREADTKVREGMSGLLTRIHLDKIV